MVLIIQAVILVFNNDGHRQPLIRIVIDVSDCYTISTFYHVLKLLLVRLVMCCFIFDAILNIPYSLLIKFNVHAYM